MAKQTPLFDAHLAANAKMVNFGGWNMPINYGSQIAEHQAVREDAGVFDVSHMTIVDITGEDALPFLQRLLANDVSRLNTPGKALYTAMLNQQAGVIDDLIVYNLEKGYRTVVNCATREQDLEWINQQAEDYSVIITERDDLAMVAVQGPNALQYASIALGDTHGPIAGQLKPFQGLPNEGWFIARTGYTGEDGLEIMVPAPEAEQLWNRLLDCGCKPCGLGARDTLRLEAGMNLYGNDMTETTNPLESGMGWTIAWEPGDRHFIGRTRLEEIKAQGQHAQLVGLILEGRGVMRAHQSVHETEDGPAVGELTSGSFSPTLNQSIGLARLPVSIKDSCFVEMRGRMLPAKIVKLPFVRNGKILVK
ncbi:MAG: glycine cleavage system aminomethyltransferase GcvT [Reinekea sp.]